MENMGLFVQTQAQAGILPKNATLTMDSLFCYEDMLKLYALYSLIYEPF